jgi:hypothetical protein
VRPWLELAEDLTELSLDKHLSVPQVVNEPFLYPFFI